MEGSMNLARRLAVIAAISATTVAPFAATVGSASAATPKMYANCTALNHVYRHGVALSKTSKDHVSGHSKPAKGMYVNAALYNVNAKHGLDRDKDHIACEKV